MSGRGLIVVVVAAIVTIGAAAFAIGQGAATDSGSATPATTAAGTAPAAATAVTIKNFAFAPPTITVKVGDSITWTNDDSTTHTVHADDGSFASQDLDQGRSFTATFSAPGTHTYICAIHNSMKGTVVVEP